MQDWPAIVHPRAQRCWTGRQVLTPQHAGHATELSREIRGAPGIVVVGGDGTLFEVLQGADLAAQTIALLPAGRGNALAKDLGAGGATAVDLMEVTADGRRWLCASSVGFGYAVTVTRWAARLRGLNHFSYLAGAVPSVPCFAGYEVGGRVERLTGLVVNNTRHIGSFYAFPAADCRDGRLDLIELHGGWLRQMAYNLSAVSGWHGYTPARMSQVARAEIALDRPAPLMLDGELLPPVSRIAVVVRPAMLRIQVLPL